MDTIDSLKKQKSYFKVSKNSEANQNIAGDVYHKGAKYQLEVICILNYTKRQNYGSEYQYFHISKEYQTLSFCVAYKKLHYGLHACRIYH